MLIVIVPLQSRLPLPSYKIHISIMINSMQALTRPTQCWVCVMVNGQKLFRGCSQHWTGEEGVTKFVLSINGIYYVCNIGISIMINSMQALIPPNIMLSLCHGKWPKVVLGCSQHWTGEEGVTKFVLSINGIYYVCNIGISIMINSMQALIPPNIMLSLCHGKWPKVVLGCSQHWTGEKAWRRLFCRSMNIKFAILACLSW